MIKTLPLGKICEIIMGQSPDGNTYNIENKGFPLVGGASDLGEKFPKPNKFTTHPTKLSMVGDIILCIRATIGDKNWSDKKYCLGRGVVSLRPIKDILNTQYLWFWLEQSKEELIKQATGSTFQQVSRGDIESLQIPLPPLPEQRRIAAILEQADELQQLRREAMNSISQLLASFFYEKFGDPIRNERGWKTKQIGQIGQVITGNTPSRNVPEYYGDFIEWVKSDNLDSFSGYILPSKEKLSKEGSKKSRIAPCGATLITCIAGSYESIGKVGFANRKLSFNQQINAIVPFKNIDPMFLFVNLKVSKLAIQSLSSKGMKGIVNKTQLENVELIVPPENLQKDFSSIAFEIMESLVDQEKSYEQYNNLFQSLLSQAFTGELTATWREKQADELAKAAQERDELLAKQKIRLTPSVKKVQEPSQLTLRQYQKLVKEKYLEVAKVMANSTDTANMLWDTRVGLMIEFIKFLLNPPNHREPILEEVIENVLESWSIEQIKRLMSNTLPILAKGYQEYGAKLMGLDGEVGVLRREIIEMTAKTARRFFCDWLYSKFLMELKSSEEQYKVYQAAISETKYFTSESLTEKIDSLSSTFVKHSLELFEAVGLIMKVSIPSYITGETRFVSAYRALWLKDIKLDDEFVDNKNYDSLDGSKIESL